MIVKKFEAPTENEAILKAREELGSHAVVLNSKKLVPRGLFRLFRKESYEITAALEEKDFISGINENKPSMDTVKQTDPSRINIKIDDTAEPVKKSYSFDILPEDRTEEKALAERLSELNGGIQETETDNANVRALKLIYSKLIESEVDEKYANAIIGEIESSLKRESDVKSILAGVYQKVILRLGEPYDISCGDKTKVLFFIGPTGVGKTTTIAKIASRLRLTDHKKVAFITADTYRISAVEQLNTYAEIMDIAIKVVYTPDELAGAVKGFCDYDYIFVDTAGRSHKNTEQIDDLNAYLDAAGAIEDIDVETLLVLSATTKYKDLVNITEAYSFVGNYYLLFTKLDETSAYGSILNIKLHTGARLTYLTMGQNVPDDIEKVNVQWLAKQIIGGNE